MQGFTLLEQIKKIGLCEEQAVRALSVTADYEKIRIRTS
jgi:hypothetical protein